MVARMTELNRDAIERIVRAIGDRLDGQWLIVGGAALALWVAPRRVTEDVDVVPILQTGSERLALLELAEQLGLPIEAVNSAADFFVRRIDGWELQLELLHRGARSPVYRPNATLMLLLKLGRLSERDLEDCKLVLATGAAVDRARLERALAALPASDDAALVERRRELRDLIGGK
jgi:hypothetical protein